MDTAPLQTPKPRSKETPELQIPIRNSFKPSQTKPAAIPGGSIRTNAQNQTCLLQVQETKYHKRNTKTQISLAQHSIAVLQTGSKQCLP